MFTQAASLLSMMALGETGGESVPAQLSAHPQPWGHSLVLPRTASSSSDIGDVEFWVTYYPGKTEAKVNFGWKHFTSGLSCQGSGTLPVLRREFGCWSWPAGPCPVPALCPSGVTKARTEPWDHKNPAWDGSATVPTVPLRPKCASY